MKPKSRTKSTPRSTKNVAKIPKKVSKTKHPKKQPSAKKTEKKMRKGSAELTAYFKSYKGGLGDFHIPIFRSLKKIASPTKVLYPGCHRHVTASLIFQNVVYVDNYAKMNATYSDEKVVEFINENKEYAETPEINFKCKNFESDFGEKAESFDLLLSLSAGIVSTSCGKYLKKGGYLLAGDAHFDARMAYTDPRFDFVGVYDDTTSEFDQSEGAKRGHFVTTKGTIMTKEMVQESIDKPKAKRSFKLQKETLFYIFRKK